MNWSINKTQNEIISNLGEKQETNTILNALKGCIYSWIQKDSYNLVDDLLCIDSDIKNPREKFILKSLIGASLMRRLQLDEIKNHKREKKVSLTELAKKTIKAFLDADDSIGFCTENSIHALKINIMHDVMQEDEIKRLLNSLSINNDEFTSIKSIIKSFMEYKKASCSDGIIDATIIE